MICVFEGDVSPGRSFCQNEAFLKVAPEPALDEEQVEKERHAPPSTAVLVLVVVVNCNLGYHRYRSLMGETEITRLSVHGS